MISGVCPCMCLKSHSWWITPQGSVSSPANLTAAELHLIFADVLLHRFYWANHDPELTRRCTTLLTLFIFSQPFGPGARLRSLRGRELSHSMLAYVLCYFLCILAHLSICLYLQSFFIIFSSQIFIFQGNYSFILFFVVVFVLLLFKRKLYVLISELFSDFGMIMLSAGHSSLTSPSVASHRVCGDIALALYAKDYSFLIITQYLIISLPCLSQCLIGLLVTFPLH